MSWMNLEPLIQWSKSERERQMPYMNTYILRAGEGDDRGWDCLKASPTQKTWVWANLGDSEGQESLACCSPWSCKELTWQQIDNNEWNLERWYWRICLQGSNADADPKNRLVDTEGEGGGGTNRVVLKDIHYYMWNRYPVGICYMTQEVQIWCSLTT